MSCGVFVTGEQVQKLLGLYMSMAVLLRPALSAPPALYDFIISYTVVGITHDGD